MQSFELPRVPEAVPTARRALRSFAHDLDAETLANAALCISELATNAVLHSRRVSADGLRIELALNGDRLRVAVVDAGSGFVAPEPALDAEGDGGWGLLVVAALSDDWGVAYEDGTKVWFEMAVDRGGRTSSTSRQRIRMRGCQGAA
jgi:anti-sigma regulatory factor (Ser/Thr protein kinase)